MFENYNEAQWAVAKAVSTYNHLWPHGSIDNLKPAQAHQMCGAIPKRWKNYYQEKKKGKKKKMEMPCKKVFFRHLGVQKYIYTKKPEINLESLTQLYTAQTSINWQYSLSQKIPHQDS